MNRIFGSLLASCLALTGCGGKLQSPDFEPKLQGLEVTAPVTPATVNIGNTLKLSANGLFSTPPGSSVSSTRGPVNNVEWSSSDAAIARVDSTGLVTGVACSSSGVMIRARAQGFEKSINVAISGIVLREINVNPPSSTVRLGSTQQFSAAGVYRDCGNVVRSQTNITETVNWSAVDSAIATVSPPTGTTSIATSKGIGTTLVRASAVNAEGKTVVGSATFKVNPPVLTDLIITPSTASIGLNATQQFTAQGRFSDGTLADPAATLTWASSNPATAMIDAATGLASSTSASTPDGTPTTTNISVSAVNDDGNTVTSTNPAVLTVKPTVLVSLKEILPKTGSAPVSISRGTTRAFVVTGNYSDGSVQTLADARADGTATLTWTTSDANRATVGNTLNSNYGVVTGVAVGLVDLTATLRVPADATGSPTTLTLTNISITDPICVVQFLHQPPSTLRDSRTMVTPAAMNGCLNTSDCKFSNDPAVVSVSQDDSASILIGPALTATTSTLVVDYIAPTDNVPPTLGGRAGFIISYNPTAFDPMRSIRMATRLNGVSATAVAPSSLASLPNNRTLLLFPVSSTLTGLELQVTAPASVAPTVPPSVPSTTATPVNVFAACGLAQPP